MRITQLNMEILQAQARLNLALFEYFTAGFCGPCYSGELEQLIRDWRENGNSKSLDNAMKLVEQLQGKILCWS